MKDTARAGSGQLEVRECSIEDAAGIAEIHNQAIWKGGATMEVVLKKPEDVVAQIQSFDERETILVLEEAGELLGWGIIKKYSYRPGYRVCCETSVFLRHGMRRKGLGTYLKRIVIERCRAYGYHHLLARIWNENKASIEYNRKLGYEIVGVQREVGHCHGQWQDICIMQLVLKDVPPYRPELGLPSIPDGASRPVFEGKNSSD